LICGAADCRHPKTAEDFLKLSPSPKVCLASPVPFFFHGLAEPSSHSRFFFIGTGQAAAIGFGHAALRRKGRQRH